MTTRTCLVPVLLLVRVNALAQPVLKPAETAAAPAAAPSPLTHENQVNLAGVFSGGNVNMVSGKGNGYDQLKFLRHALPFHATAGVSGQAVDSDKDPATGFRTALQDNLATWLNGRMRYDFFLSENDTLHASYFLGHDAATNFTQRNRIEAGYRRFIFQQPKESLSVETGLVYSLDFAPMAGDTDGDGRVNVFKGRSRLEKTGGTVEGRLLVSYSLALSDVVQLQQTVDVFPNLFPEVEAPFESARVNPAADNKLGLLEASAITSLTQVNVAPSKNITAGMALAFVCDSGAIARRNAYSNADISLAGSPAVNLL
jgi:hypothetical protein